MAKFYVHIKYVSAPLEVYEFSVVAILLQQLIVAAPFDDLALLEHRIMSALQIVAKRWAMMMVVRPRIRRSSTVMTSCSALASRAAVGSSRIRIGASA